MVSGIAAVALSMNDNLTSEEFKKLLIETVEDLDSITPLTTKRVMK